MRLLLVITAALVTALGVAAPARAEWIWPLQGEVITPYRNGDDPYAGGQHRGIDIAGPVGSRVVAATSGEVRFAGTAGSSGLTVSLRTADGRFDTSYLHLSSISVREGQSVSTGDAVGAVGTTGARSASEPHLHFGVRDAGTRHDYRNPLDFLPPRPAPPVPETPPATPAPVPAPRPATPPASPAAEPAPRRVPVGGRAPQRVPVGGRAPQRVPVGGRAPEHVPVSGRAPERVPVSGRAPRRVPAGGRAPRPLPAAHPAPRGVPITEPRPALVPGSDPAPRGAPSTDPSARGVPSEVPATHSRPMPLGGRAADGVARSGSPRHASPGLAPDGGSISQPHVGPQARGATDGPTRAAGSGPDIGWILACVGLLVAAAMLGLTEDGRKATRAGHSHMLRLLRPLRGRG